MPIGRGPKDELIAYLEDPTAYTKAKNGNRSSMAFKLKDLDERKAVVEYLKSALSVSGRNTKTAGK